MAEVFLDLLWGATLGKTHFRSFKTVSEKSRLSVMLSLGFALPRGHIEGVRRERVLVVRPEFLRFLWGGFGP
ncbi:hypothetical protein [Falsihalocynthiibacter arcticus]|uniref:Uncharacterized protein n=1 Tax=Falsihalocynthiibacter arcticus TaxID=1579316 RepID=A0A126V164_9RHOB|nr:hypothetical protein [Falsihalocynthiibacter arcticus]AML52033.1 hypothetical protein RC74_12800 [Falsihalocynthiibacter arcticus]